jgi:hypothetical protein
VQVGSSAALQGAGSECAFQHGEHADPACGAFKEELQDLSARVGDRQEYPEHGARSPAGRHELACAAAHLGDLLRWQGSSGVPHSKMEDMVEMSREKSQRPAFETAIRVEDGGDVA